MRGAGECPCGLADRQDRLDPEYRAHSPLQARANPVQPFFFLDKKRICLHFPICVEGETLGPADQRGPGPPGVLELPGSIFGSLPAAPPLFVRAIRLETARVPGGGPLGPVGAVGWVAPTGRGLLSGTRSLGRRGWVTLEAGGLSATVARWPADSMLLRARPQNAARGSCPRKVSRMRRRAQGMTRTGLISVTPSPAPVAALFPSLPSLLLTPASPLPETI